MIKLIHAVALTVFSFGIALFFSSVRQLFIEAWSGVAVKVISSDDLEIPNIIPDVVKPKKKDIELTFELIEQKTTELEYHYTDRPIHNFTNILCPAETVVKYEDQEIHGNWVQMPDGNNYIATQAPNYQTGLFWQVAHHNQGFIVDITTPRDNISTYYPTGNNMEFYVDASVKLKNTEEIADQFTLYTYEVLVGEETREVQRLHFSGWIDFDGTSIETLERLVNIITEKMGENKVPIIHCRAGVGRTGTLISTITLKNMIDQGIVTSENINEKIEEVIITGRKCRGPGFVQTKEQFQVIKEAVTA